MKFDWERVRIDDAFRELVVDSLPEYTSWEWKQEVEAGDGLWWVLDKEDWPWIRPVEEP